MFIIHRVKKVIMTTLAVFSLVFVMQSDPKEKIHIEDNTGDLTLNFDPGSFGGEN